MAKTIVIKCTGTESKSIDELVEFQGDLKKITKKNLEKLKNNIIENGFIAPIFVWKDGKQNKIIDGHQRLKALTQLREEGYSIPSIPVVYIEADNEKDARKKLLAVSSQYGDFEIVEAEEWLKEIDGKNNFRLLTEKEEILFIGNEKKEKPDIQLKKEISKAGDIWTIGKNIKLYCDDSTGKKHDWDLLFYDPMFDDENIYESIPKYNTGKKMLLFYDFISCGIGIHMAIEKGWPFNFEFILDGCTSWYVPGRPLKRHRACVLFGNEKWNYEKAIFDDGIVREDTITSNHKGKFICKALDSGKHLSSVERWANAGNKKEYSYEKPLPWIRALLNGCIGVSSIYDPFAGSFTAGIIAFENNVEYNGYEIDPKIFDIGLMKLYQETGIDPIREDDRKKFTELLLG